jgi:vitamin B12 transporter
MKKKCPSVFSVIFLCLPFLLFSQEQKEKSAPPSEHHEIVVTATRLEVAAREVASSVTVISSEDLERLKKISALEVLRDVLGVSVIQNGGQGETASVFLRGANSEHTLVLLDGVELNDPINPSRSADLAHIYLENIDRIEVIRGPQSPLFGSDALGGIINIITKKGEGTPRLTLASTGGSYGTWAGQAGISGASKKVNYSFGLSRFGTQGISAADSTFPGNSEIDGYRNLTFSGQAGLVLRDNLEINLIARSVRAKTEIDNFGGPYGDDPNNAQDYRSYFIKGEFRGLFFGNRWEQKLAIGAVDSRRSNDNPADNAHPLESEAGLFKSRLVKLDWQNNFFLLPSNTVTVGVEYETEEGESSYFAEGVWGSSLSEFARQRAAMAGIYVQDYIRLADRFFATIGLRLDRHSQAGDSATYRLAPAYIFKPTGTKIRASAGTAFKAPSLYQLYAPGTFLGPIGNKSLKPEKSLGWDAGVEQPLFGGRMRLGAGYFHNDFENLINFDFTQGYTNIGKAVSQGVEIELQGRPNETVFLRASYTHLDAKDKATGALLLRRPRDMFAATLSVSISEKWMASISWDFVGKREDLELWSWPSRTVTLPPYSLLNGLLSYDFSPNVQVYGRLDNILAEKYETVYGYGTLGFSAQAGVKIVL